MKKFISLIPIFCLFVFISCENNEESNQQLEPKVFDENKILTKALANGDSQYLRYYGNRKWYCYFGGVNCWFEGASPIEIENGMRSSWQMITPPSNPLHYEQSGVSSWGGARRGFYISRICASNASLRYGYLFTITKTTTKDSTSFYSINPKNTRRIPSLGPGTTCTYRGQIALDSNCKPMIVSTDSELPSGCMQDDTFPDFNDDQFPE